MLFWEGTIAPPEMRLFRSLYSRDLRRCVEYGGKPV
jgi:hypothetical protein